MNAVKDAAAALIAENLRVVPLRPSKDGKACLEPGWSNRTFTLDDFTDDVTGVGVKPGGPRNLVIVENDDPDLALVTLVEPSARLVQLAADIEVEHEAACRSGADMLGHWRRAGVLLRLAKRRVERECGYGQWEAWLAQHCPRSARSARRYMRVSKQWSRVKRFGHAVSDLALDAAEATLSLRVLDRALANPRPNPEDSQNGEQPSDNFELRPPEQLLLPASSVSVGLVVNDLKVKRQEMSLLRQWVEQGRLGHDDLLRVLDAFDPFLTEANRTRDAISRARAAVADPREAQEVEEVCAR